MKYIFDSYTHTFFCIFMIFEVYTFILSLAQMELYIKYRPLVTIQIVRGLIALTNFSDFSHKRYKKVNIMLPTCINLLIQVTANAHQQKQMEIDYRMLLSIVLMRFCRFHTFSYNNS